MNFSNIWEILLGSGIAWVIGGLLIISSIHQILYYTYIWQLKEYRLDRFMDSLTTKSGLSRVIPWFLSIKAALFLSGLLYFVVTKDWDWFAILGVIGLAIEMAIIAIKIVKRKIYRPDFTFKAILLMALAFALSLGELAILKMWLGVEEAAIMTVLVILSNLLIPLKVSLAVLIFYPVTLILKNRKIDQARMKINKLNNLKVVGITGSYGKSSTKEFLYQILKSKFKVLKTPGNVNVDIGVAQVVLRDLNEEHEIFIAEMGAYKMGEIRKICEIVKPQIGIITAVKDSHLALFGSFENLKKAKNELIECLDEKEGVGIFNMDNEGSYELAMEAKEKGGKVYGYSLKNKAKFNAEQIETDENGLSFILKGVKFKAALFGKQNIPSLMAAIIAARRLGMKMEEIAVEVEKILPQEKTMNLDKSSAKFWVLDDSYNASPDGVMAALDYLGGFKDRKRVLVFPGMLELGEKSDSEHIRVAKKIVKSCDLAIFTSTDFEKPLMDGLGKMDKEKYTFIREQEEVLKFLKEKVGTEKAVVLFESRGAEKVRKELKNL
jgi:UDP-N-acetylmuramoyl-tripeptide--D-alanyl-D-alanine ligase